MTQISRRDFLVTIITSVLFILTYYNVFTLLANIWMTSQAYSLTIVNQSFKNEIINYKIYQNQFELFCSVKKYIQKKNLNLNVYFMLNEKLSLNFYIKLLYQML